MSTTGRTPARPVEHHLTRDGKVLRYEVMPDGRRRHLIEDEQSRGEVLVQTNYSQLEMRIAAQLLEG